MEFLDGSTLVSSDRKGSTKFWDISTGTANAEVPGKTFAFSKAAAGTEQRAGGYIITAAGDLLLVHHADGGETRDVKKVPVALFRAPSPVISFACMGEYIGVGCQSGAVLHLRAAWLVEAG